MIDEARVTELARHQATEQGCSIKHAGALVLRAARLRTTEKATTGGTLDAEKLADIEREAGIL